MPHRLSVATILFAGSAFAALAGHGKTDTASAGSTQPVVVELFQSQGCSSCSPANADLNAIANRGDVLALSFAVTYWDRLGWKDTFGSARFTARQQDYSRAGRGEVATPEFIVNGTYAILGSNRPALDAAIARARALTGGPTITKVPSGVHIEALPRSAPAVVWLVRYDPRTRQVPIRAGENGGRTLPHRNIVRDLVRLGDWTGQARSFVLPNAREVGLATAVFVQRGSGGPVMSARKL